VQVQPAPRPSTSKAIEPEMVNIPAGTFTIGCKEDRDNVEGGCSDDEKPAHEVSITAFQLAATDVTFDQWDACEAAKACPHAKDEGWGRGNRPVINVSWNDAKTYLQWLSKESGKDYRLPSEAEWEYAARARTATAYPWGSSIGKNKANCDGCGSQWDNKQTSPVGSFAANPFGLYDMSGNVWQWVEDCYVNSYTDAPSDGSAREGCGANASRVLRGGSWSNFPQWLRSATRNNVSPAYRYSLVGFRAARTL
jgi:formylglycine-generating enzyme required for sulfatase activity